jgi:hypothetical protein
MSYSHRNPWTGCRQTQSLYNYDMFTTFLTKPVEKRTNKKWAAFSDTARADHLQAFHKAFDAP